MKNLYAKLLLLSLFLLIMKAHASNHMSQNQNKNKKYSQSETIEKNFKFETLDTNNQMTVYNVYGSINIQGHDSDEIIVEAKNKVFANTQDLVNKGLDEIGLAIKVYEHKVYVYLDSPFTHFDSQKDKIWHNNLCNGHDDCIGKYRKKRNYTYEMDITIKLPKSTNLKVSAINNGHIKVSDIQAKKLYVNNINGPIDMVNVSGKTHANAINKDINIKFNQNPSEDSFFESINGDINIVFADNPNAQILYQSMNGDFYTNQDVSEMAPKLIKMNEQKQNGIVYKLNAKNRLLLGKGGPNYQFKTLNGDIKIKSGER